MTRPIFTRWPLVNGWPGALALILAGCAPPVPDATSRGDFTAELVHSDAGAPPSDQGLCWAKDDIPAVIETVTEQVLLTPEIRDETGTLIQPPVYSSTVDQRMVKDRETVWFQTPCPELIPADFVATLQRALKARGLYLRPLSGVMDADTTTAIRRFQAERGLDSEILSLAAARELGLIEVPRAAL